VKSTSQEGTVFRVVLPLVLEPRQKTSEGEHVRSVAPLIQ
jgi:hypothetical protein